jgi:hypothetical protein
MGKGEIMDAVAHAVHRYALSQIKLDLQKI